MPVEVHKVLQQCIDLDEPFALALLPGSRTLLRFPEEATGSSFVVGFFDDSRPPITIGASPVHSPLIHPTAVSTDYAAYALGAEYVISQLRAHGGKTVLSRVIAVESAKPIAEVVCDYFAHFPYTMRFVFYTAESGLWFGASPELLIDNGPDCLKTMSLAGTRCADSIEPWDTKNVSEHQYVTDYLMEALRADGLDPVIIDSTPLRFGDIEHLCDRISAKPHPRAIDLIRRLSPTPALCGSPKAEAYRLIRRAEAHERHCYGGWVAVCSADGAIRAYVNLRSAFAERRGPDIWLYNVYAGGGLTAQSVVAEEWQEADAKAETLIGCIKL